MIEFLIFDFLIFDEDGKQVNYIFMPVIDFMPVIHFVY